MQGALAPTTTRPAHEALQPGPAGSPPENKSVKAEAGSEWAGARAFRAPDLATHTEAGSGEEDASTASEPGRPSSPENRLPALAGVIFLRPDPPPERYVILEMQCASVQSLMSTGIATATEILTSRASSRTQSPCRYLSSIGLLGNFNYDPACGY
jgi:hypothetical protein